MRHWTYLAKKGFFGDECSDFNISKNNFLENKLCYVNNDTVKGGETAVCLQNFILGQLVVAANGPENIDSYECKKMRSSYFTWFRIPQMEHFLV